MKMREVTQDDDETDCSKGGKIITEVIDLDLPPEHLLWSPHIILQ